MQTELGLVHLVPVSKASGNANKFFGLKVYLLTIAQRFRVRIGNHNVPVRAGDYVALLSGSDSTMIKSEVNFYPESNWVGFFCWVCAG